jgi:hypothetical protein
MQNTPVCSFPTSFVGIWAFCANACSMIKNWTTALRQFAHG